MTTELELLKQQLEKAEQALSKCKGLSVQVEGLNSKDRSVLFALEGLISDYFKNKAECQ